MILRAADPDREMAAAERYDKSWWIARIMGRVRYQNPDPAVGAAMDASVCKMMTETPAFLQTLTIGVLKTVIAKLPDVACPLESIYSERTGRMLRNFQQKPEIVNQVFQYLPIKMEVNFDGRSDTMVVKRHWSKEELLGRIMIKWGPPPDISYQYGGSFDVHGL
jgi:hypothetical protein